MNFLNAAGGIVTPYAGGKELAAITAFDISELDPRIGATEFLVASDVTNPLHGPHGAAAVFGPQKGATPEMVAILDANLKHFGEVILKTNKRDVLTVAGGGAAGGMGAALIAFINATLRPGINLVMEATHFESLAREASLIITAEGNVDSQTLDGKAPAGIAAMAAKYGVPVLVIGGGLTDDASRLYEAGCAIISATTRPMTLDDAIANVAVHLPNAAECAAQLIKTGMKMNASLKESLLT